MNIATWLRKSFHTPVGHSHPMERTVEPTSCDATVEPTFRGGYEVSDMVATAVPFEPPQLAACPSPTSWKGKPKQEQQEQQARRAGGGGRRGWRRRRGGG